MRSLESLHRKPSRLKNSKPSTNWSMRLVGDHSPPRMTAFSATIYWNSLVRKGGHGHRQWKIVVLFRKLSNLLISLKRHGALPLILVSFLCCHHGIQGRSRVQSQNLGFYYWLEYDGVVYLSWTAIGTEILKRNRSATLCCGDFVEFSSHGDDWRLYPKIGASSP